MTTTTGEIKKYGMLKYLLHMPIVEEIQQSKTNNAMKPDERLNRVKVYVEGKSQEILTKAFKLGYFGRYDIRTKVEDKPFLYFCDGKIRLGISMKEFGNSDFMEMKANDILAIDELDKPRLVPFQKVLARNYNHEVWSCDFFSHIEEDTNAKITTSGVRKETERKYVCVASDYDQCIPYEGNEHLLGTDDKPRK